MSFINHIENQLKKEKITSKEALDLKAHYYSLTPAEKVDFDSKYNLESIEKKSKNENIINPKNNEDKNDDKLNDENIEVNSLNVVDESVSEQISDSGKEETKVEKSLDVKEDKIIISENSIERSDLELMECVVCKNRIPQNATKCPNCKIVYRSESENEEEDISNWKDNWTWSLLAILYAIFLSAIRDGGFSPLTIAFAFGTLFIPLVAAIVYCMFMGWKGFGLAFAISAFVLITIGLLGGTFDKTIIH